MLVLKNIAQKMPAARSFTSHSRRSLQLSTCIAAICSGEALMTKCIGAAVLAVTLMFGGSAATGPALAAPLPAAVQKSLQERQASKAAELSARRRIGITTVTPIGRIIGPTTRLITTAPIITRRRRSSPSLGSATGRGGDL